MRSVLFAAALTAIAAAEDAATPPTSETAARPQFTPYTGNAPSGFIEQFVEETFARWSPSKALKGTIGSETFSYVGKWETLEPSVYPGLQGDLGLVVTNQAAHHAISAPLDTPIDPSKEDVVVQYEVKLQKGLECGGAYIKLLTESDEGIQASEFSDKTPYTVMFGPDKCGGTNKVHLILRHKSPKTGEIEEKHLVAPPQPRITKTTTLYTLQLKHDDQSYEIWINDVSAKKGSLEKDFDPPFVPPTEIDDPDDKKPEDWVDQAKITDPDATKPDDWDEDAPLEIPDEDATKPAGWLEDEPATIPDPEAQKPEEWDDEEDGDWIPPSVPNPKCEEAPGCGPWLKPNKPNPSYKGKWYAPLIDNPLYKGIWKAKRIPNPAHYDDKAPLSNIGKIAAVGFEIWSMQSDITFDNIYVGSSLAEANAFAKATFHVKKPIEDAAEAAETKGKDSHSHAKTGLDPDFKADPLGYIRTAFLEFYELAKLDPIYALKSQPKTAAVAGGLLATLVGMLGVFATLFSGKPQVQEIKKKAVDTAQVAKEKATEVAAVASEKAAEVTEAVKQKADETTTTVKKRAGKGKAAAVADE